MTYSPKLRVAVMFGGPSAEHDVSILTGLEALAALDPARYEGFPLYVDLEGRWWLGEALRVRKNFLPDAALRRQLTRVVWPVGGARAGAGWALQAYEAPLFGRPARFPVDVLLPCFHGTWGEDGTLQGALLGEGVALAGSGPTALGLAMDKYRTLQLVGAAGVPVLPSLLVPRGTEADEARCRKLCGKAPWFVKPNFLGSSIGVGRAPDGAALQAAVRNVHRLDTAAIVQPCMENLVEYNVAVRRLSDGRIVTSAIERPKASSETLDFHDKYLQGGGLNKIGEKLGGGGLGMAGATRAINPAELASGKGKALAESIRAHAATVFETLGMAGAPRLDFMLNSQTGALYFNEINSIPGSNGYFLWEAAEDTEARVGYTALLEAMIAEARTRLRSQHRLVDPVAAGGSIFPKRGV